MNMAADPDEDEFRQSPDPSGAVEGASSESFEEHQRRKAIPVEPQDPPPIDPVDVVATLLLGHALAGCPDLLAAAANGGVAVVVDVPGAAWVDPIGDAWGKLTKSSDILRVGERVYRSPTTWTQATWLSFHRDGSGRDHRPSDGNLVVCLALAHGANVVGFSPSPCRHLPRDLLRSADFTVAIPPLNSRTLSEALALFVGEQLAVGLPDQLCRILLPQDLKLACRPNQTADRYMARLRRLVGGGDSGQGPTLDDLLGMDEAVQWGRAVARDLRQWTEGQLPWSAVDRGALLYGPPGTGKTMFCRALANTCCVPLLAESLAKWQAAGHLGDLLREMRRAFDAARSAAPSVLLVDEVDSFGDRSKFTHDYRDYSIQVVNGFLEELDGAIGREGVLVLGACNNPNLLDPAIVRPGRLDRAIHIGFPDEKALVGILRFHLRGDLAGESLSEAALLALGGTGADCERWVRGAKRRAREAGRPMALADLLAEIRGPGNRSGARRRRSAIHEAGHALAVHLLRPGALTGATIRGTSDIGGLTKFGPGKHDDTREGFFVEIRILLAGRAAEETLLGEPSAGAGGEDDSDLARATALAVSVVSAYGLGGELLWTGLPTPKELPKFLARRPQTECRATEILADAYARDVVLFREWRNALEVVADTLAAKSTVTAAEVRAIAAKSRPSFSDQQSVRREAPESDNLDID